MFDVVVPVVDEGLGDDLMNAADLILPDLAQDMMLHVDIEDEIPDMPKSPEPSPPNQIEAVVPEGESSSQSRLSQFTSRPSELYPEELAPQIVGIFHDNLYAIGAAVRILNSNESRLLRRNSDSSTLSYRRGSVNYSINQPLIRRANSAPTSLYSSCSGIFQSIDHTPNANHLELIEPRFLH